MPVASASSSAARRCSRRVGPGSTTSASRRRARAACARPAARHRVHPDRDHRVRAQPDRAQRDRARRAPPRWAQRKEFEARLHASGQVAGLGETTPRRCERCRGSRWIVELTAGEAEAEPGETLKPHERVLCEAVERLEETGSCLLHRSEGEERCSRLPGERIAQASLLAGSTRSAAGVRTTRARHRPYPGGMPSRRH